jgi:ribonuclease HI
MSTSAPHFLLLTDTIAATHDERSWRFVLQPVGDGERIAADDIEIDADANRLELLAVVRGLEALDGPSRVTLLCDSRYVRRGIRHDLAQWRENDWRWEHFGKLVPIRDLDLWQRLDRALAIHQVDCYFGLRIADCEIANVAKESQTSIEDETRVKSTRRTSSRGRLSAQTGAAEAALCRSA